jgi:hypothetical protein
MEAENSPKYWCQYANPHGLLCQKTRSLINSLKPSKALKLSGSPNGGEMLIGHRQLSKEESATLRRWLFFCKMNNAVRLRRSRRLYLSCHCTLKKNLRPLQKNPSIRYFIKILRLFSSSYLGTDRWSSRKYNPPQVSQKDEDDDNDDNNNNNNCET